MYYVVEREKEAGIIIVSNNHNNLYLSNMLYFVMVMVGT